MRRLGVAFLIGALAVGATAQAYARTPLAATPISRLDLSWWKHRFEAKQYRLHDAPVGLVFYGDSITQDWERTGPPEWADFAPSWQHFYGTRDAVNLGFKGDTTASLLWRIEHGEADGIAPKAAVILIGANNLGRLHWSADDTVAGIAAIVTELRRRLPTTRLLLLSVLPSDRSAWATRTTREINHDLAARYVDARVPNVTWLDVTGVFERDGQLDRAAFLDPLLTPPDPPLHPTAQAQARLSAAMEPALAKLLGDAPHDRR
ncbi:MAG: GDSL-type esterase/lipase family protein [Acetobacteraceae bacterium]